MENEEPKKPKRIYVIGSVGGNISASMALLHKLEEIHKGEIIILESSKDLKKHLFHEKEVLKEVTIPIRNLICEIPVNNYDYFAEKKAQDENLKRQNKLREKHFNKNSTKMFRKKK